MKAWSAMVTMGKSGSLGSWDSEMVNLYFKLKSKVSDDSDFNAREYDTNFDTDSLSEENKKKPHLFDTSNWKATSCR